MSDLEDLEAIADSTAPDRVAQDRRALNGSKPGSKASLSRIRERSRAMSVRSNIERNLSPVTLRKFSWEQT